MRHTFTSEFLRVTPPATNFGEAWELLCFALLRAETSDTALLRLLPPDRGVDILNTKTGNAYQCKSSERGVFGTLDATDCIASLKTAVAAKSALGWNEYYLATNAQITGSGLAKIYECAAAAEVQKPTILAPEYWDGLCEKHKDLIVGFFDYRVFVSESEVIEVFQKARYYESVVAEAQTQLSSAPMRITVSNNRTPLLLDLPFSSELTIEKLLDVAQELMGITLDWANYPDLGTSCGPSLSMTVDQRSLPFKKKLGELTDDERSKLQLWIKLVWQDGLRKDKDGYDGTAVLRSMLVTADTFRPSTSKQDRGRETISRTQTVIETTIWKAIANRRRADA
jgi:hypothetical protein